LANFVPDSPDHLSQIVRAVITKQSKMQNLLQPFFEYAKLPLNKSHSPPRN
jgi:hypothetical protein